MKVFITIIIGITIAYLVMRSLADVAEKHNLNNNGKSFRARKIEYFSIYYSEVFATKSNNNLQFNNQYSNGNNSKIMKSSEDWIVLFNDIQVGKVIGDRIIEILNYCYLRNCLIEIGDIEIEDLMNNDSDTLNFELEVKVPEKIKLDFFQKSQFIYKTYKLTAFSSKNKQEAIADTDFDEQLDIIDEDGKYVVYGDDELGNLPSSAKKFETYDDKLDQDDTFFAFLTNKVLNDKGKYEPHVTIYSTLI